MAKRWKVEIHFKSKIAHYGIEELEQLQDIVENGPDFTTIEKIIITYQRLEKRVE